MTAGLFSADRVVRWWTRVLTVGRGLALVPLNRAAKNQEAFVQPDQASDVTHQPRMTYVRGPCMACRVPRIPHKGGSNACTRLRVILSATLPSRILQSWGSSWDGVIMRTSSSER